MLAVEEGHFLAVTPGVLVTLRTRRSAKSSKPVIGRIR
jgi:hypothetical protein